MAQTLLAQKLTTTSLQLLEAGKESWLELSEKTNERTCQQSGLFPAKDAVLEIVSKGRLRSRKE
jgi:hypothetical protein